MRDLRDAAGGGGAERSSASSTGSSAAVPRRSSASSTTSPSTTRYAFSVSANTGRVSAFSSREGAPFTRLMDAFDPAVLVDGEGKLYLCRRTTWD